LHRESEIGKKLRKRPNSEYVYGEEGGPGATNTLSIATYAIRAKRPREYGWKKDCWKLRLSRGSIGFITKLKGNRGSLEGKVAGGFAKGEGRT